MSAWDYPPTQRERVVAWAKGQPGQVFTVREVAESVGITKKSAGNILTTLERAGLVERLGAPLPVGRRENTYRWVQP